MLGKELRGRVVAPTKGNKDKALGQHAHIFDHFLISLMSLFSLWFSLLVVEQWSQPMLIY
jgi:hypothetical protein